MTIEPLTPERRREQTREHLLLAAAEVFARRGFDGASLDEVAATAGFSKGAVYSNFKSKEDLCLALMEESFARQTEALEATLARQRSSDVPSEQRLSEYVGLVLGEMLAGTQLYLQFCAYASRNRPTRERLAELERQDVRSIARILESERERQGLDELESPERTARIIVALFHGLGMLRAVEPDAYDEVLLEDSINFVARAMGAPI